MSNGKYMCNKLLSSAFKPLFFAMKSNVLFFFFREKGVSYTVNQMRGAGTEKKQTHLTQAFDNHEFMVLETFSALNTCVY